MCIQTAFFFDRTTTLIHRQVVLPFPEVFLGQGKLVTKHNTQ